MRMWFGDALRYKGAAMGSEKKDHGAGVERKKECGTEVKKRWRRGRRGGSGVRLRNMKCSRITRNTSNSIKIINETRRILSKSLTKHLKIHRGEGVSPLEPHQEASN
jgi:hypothetical protein